MESGQKGNGSKQGVVTFELNEHLLPNPAKVKRPIVILDINGVLAKKVYFKNLPPENKLGIKVGTKVYLPYSEIKTFIEKLFEMYEIVHI